MAARKGVRKIRTDSDKVFSNRELCDRLSAALDRAFGGDTGAVKRLARTIGANTATARNWIEGRNAPSAVQLVQLIAECDEVAFAVLEAAGRAELLDATRRAAAIESLRDVLGQLGGAP